MITRGSVVNIATTSFEMNWKMIDATVPKVMAMIME